MIILNKISKSYGDKLLFKDVNLNIYNGEKIGIIGANGSGKSTFIKIIAREIDADEGIVKCKDEIAYVKQVAEEILLEKNSKEQYINFFKTNKELHLDNNLNQSFDTLSGGEQIKFMISYALSKNSNTILLDEPTNNLDLEGTLWLINKINNFNGTVIVVSHDRYFLDKTVNKILEFENGEITEYYGGYSDYEIQKQEKLEYIKKEYEEKLYENKKLQGQIQRLSQLTAQLEKSTKKDGSSDKRAKGYKDSAQRKVKKVARQADAKRNRLIKLQNELGDRPYESKEVFYRVNAEQLHNKLLFKINDVSKSFNNCLLFKNVNLVINNGDKIALAGSNGCGKTTFIKMLLGEEDFNGEIWRNQNLKIAYLSQNGFNTICKKTIIELASEFGEYKTQFLTNLCNMGFDRDVFNKNISNLSSGEKMKLKINELIVGDFNFLILDEPTNNLDIQNKKFLEQVLKGYSGNLLIVSHDKSFIDNVCNKKITIQNKKMFEE